MSPKYSTDGALSTNGDTSIRSESRRVKGSGNSEKVELETEDMTYVEEYECGDGNVSAYRICGAEKALEASSGSSWEEWRDKQLESKSGDDNAGAEETEKYIESVVKYLDGMLEQKICDEVGRDSGSVFAAAYGSVGQLTCVEPPKRQFGPGQEEGGEVDIDLYISMERGESDGQGFSALETAVNGLDKAKNCPNDEEVRTFYDEVINNTNGVNPHSKKVKNGRCNEQRLPIHPVGVENDMLIEKLGNEGDMFETDYPMVPLDRTGGVFGDTPPERRHNQRAESWAISMWEGAIVPKKFANEEVMRALDKELKRITNNEGCLIREEIGPKMRSYIESKYCEGVFVSESQVRQ